MSKIYNKSNNYYVIVAMNMVGKVFSILKNCCYDKEFSLQNKTEAE